MTTASHITQSQETEQDLVNYLRSNNQQEFSKLFDRFSPAILGTIMKWIKDPEMAKDLLQDVFIKAWRCRAFYNTEKGRLFTWLYRIARNICIDHLRSKTYRYRHVVEINETINATTIVTAATMPDAIGLNKLVERLAPQEKQVLDLVYFKGFTQRQVAEIMNIPLGTVKTKVTKAIQELRYYYKKDWKKASAWVSLN